MRYLSVYKKIGKPRRKGRRHFYSGKCFQKDQVTVNHRGLKRKSDTLSISINNRIRSRI